MRLAPLLVNFGAPREQLKSPHDSTIIASAPMPI